MIAFRPLTRTGTTGDRHPAGLEAFFTASRSAFFSVALFTAVINILALSGSLFMMEVYNRVLPSRSLPTLAVLSAMVFFLLAIQGVLDMLRGRLLLRIGNALHEANWRRAYACLIALPVKSGPGAAGLQPIRDLDTVRSFLSSQGPATLFDLVWIPFYLFILFLFHFYLGLVALTGGLLLVSFTLLTEVLTRRALGAAAKAVFERDSLGELSRRNAETILALGMEDRMAGRWRAIDEHALWYHRQAGDVALSFSAASRMLRLMIQSAVLGVGALLVIQERASGGLIVAGAILAARALAPIDLAIAHWRGLTSARQSWRRLTGLIQASPPPSFSLPLPAPKARLEVENLSVVAPGAQRLVLQNVTFSLKAGDALGVIGPSASGKSSLARSLVGIWPALAGTVRLDGAAIDQWSAEALGRQLGYLPQHVDLLPGSIAENVARFDPGAEMNNIIAAAQAADVHDLVLSLPDGYDTLVGPQAPALSAGQQQRIALARALYGEPFLVVLDEPNSSLDGHGEAALSKAIQLIRARGGIAVVVSHRPSALIATNRVAMLFAGRIERFGPTEEVIKSPRQVTGTVQRMGPSHDRPH